jgi:hypothetical protein
MRGMGYTVTHPTETFLGKTYADWVEDWSRWFFLPDANQNNSGSVVFLKGLSPSLAKNEGVIMVGNDSLEISENQRVMLPLITSTVVAESGESSQTLYELARSDIDNGENPPEQDHVRIDNSKFNESLERYRFETRVFQLNIPSSLSGQSLADYVVPTISTRDTNLPCVTAGYFVLLQLTPGEHTIFSSVYGSRDQTGLYRASLLYHIVVEAQRGRITQEAPPTPTFSKSVTNQLRANFIAALRKKRIKGDISDSEFDSLVKQIP